MNRLNTFVTLATLVASGPAAADVITDWNNVALDIFRAKPENPLVATRSLAMMHIAMFDGVNGVDRQYEPYHVNGRALPGASAKAAAAAAAHKVLSALYPDFQDDLDAALDDSLSGICLLTFPPVLNCVAKITGTSWGRKIAGKILELRQHDNWDVVVEYEASGEFGRWQPTPPAFAAALLPNWPLVTPWTMASGDQFASGPTLSFESEEFATAYNEVQDLGQQGSTVRTEDQTIIAYFWEDGGGSVTPPGHWMVIAQGIAETFGNSLIENARLFALLAIAQADAAIAVWDNKYTFDYVRPVTNIALEADFDGNDETHADPSWLPELPTPPHPSYSSGHSGFSRVSAEILARFYEADDIFFCGESPDPGRWEILPGVLRCWDSFSDAAEEAGQSRIYGGIHWQFDNQASQDLGVALSDEVFNNFLVPLD